jgi:uncharacterized protein
VHSTYLWWQLLVVPALLLIAYVSLWSGIQPVVAANVARTDVGSTTPPHRGLAYQDMEFATSDGLRLSGWYIPSTNPAAVVLLYSPGSTRSDRCSTCVGTDAAAIG